MQPDLPTGVVSLLFTDIEGSTRLLAELKTDYVEALGTHRQALERACGAVGGTIVDSQGDAMLMAFARPGDATAAAAAAQRQLAGGPIKVRMGIHSGTPELRDGAYVGMDVHRGARIAAAGHGGQVLLSAATQALVGDPVEDLGRHWLKDLDEPEHIYQLSLEGFTSAFPALRTVEADRPQMPAWATSFAGRERELARLETLLDDPSHRIITLVGPGGAGKTRLALEATSRYWQRHRRQVVFIPLVTVASADQLVTTIAEALDFAIDLAHGAGRSPEDQLLDFLRTRSALLVADNFEQLLPAAATLSRIVETASAITVMVTSRTRLDLAGEWPIDVGSLDGHAHAGAAGRRARARPRHPGLAGR